MSAHGVKVELRVSQHRWFGRLGVKLKMKLVAGKTTLQQVNLVCCDQNQSQKMARRHAPVPEDLFFDLGVQSKTFGLQIEEEREEQEVPLQREDSVLEVGVKKFFDVLCIIQAGQTKATGRVAILLPRRPLVLDEVSSSLSSISNIVSAILFVVLDSGRLEEPATG
jgi:hypothetical protein